MKYTEVYNLQKQAAAYTPDEWRKYVPAKDRELLNRAQLKLAGSLPGITPVLSTALSGIHGIVGGSIAAGLTPSWTREDLEEYINTQNLKNKNIFIPGYLQYKALKMNGFRRALVKRLLAAKAAAKNNSKQ